MPLPWARALPDWAAAAAAVRRAQWKLTQSDPLRLAELRLLFDTAEKILSAGVCAAA